MKKILLSVISVCCLAGAPMHADAACGGNSVRFSGFKEPDDNEYIYALTSDFDKVNSGYPGANNFTTSGSVWECGSNSCAHHSGIIAPAGHAWDNHRQRDEIFYWCNNAFGDSWQEYDLIPCYDSFYESLAKNPSLENLNIDMNGTSDEMIYRIDSNRGKTTVFCYTNPERVACVKTDGAQWFNGECQCLELNGVAREWNGTTCVAKPNAAGISDGNNTAGQDNAQDAGQESVVAGAGAQDGNNTAGQDNAQGAGQESVVAGAGAQSGDTLNQTERCIRNRCGGLSGSTKSQCVTCCYVPSSVATWNKATRVCECPNTSTHVFNPSTLQCEPIEPSVTQVQSSEPDYECDQTQINNLLTLQVQYATNTSIVAQINQVIEYCDGDPSEIVFNSMINQINIAISGVNTQAEQNQANQRIDQAVATLNTIRDGLRVNKWRNEEGKFNTSRLVSDSIAGVVLGTAGGLITSSVVKKSQVSDGFEDMQCTVGGQVVAGWGDEFRVGIQ